MKASSKHEDKTRRAGLQTILLLVVIAGLWSAFSWFTASSEPFPGFLTGTYGDGFGVLTSLFTGLALAGLWYTIQLQRIELSETREVLKQQSRSLEAQSKSSQVQVVEATFFQLLQRFSEVARDVKRGAEIGRGAIAAYYRDFKDQATNRTVAAPVPSALISVEVFGRYLTANQQELNHYFRTLYHVFKFIDEHDALSDEDKIRYANVARAQLSTYEVLLLAYNGLVGEGEGFKYLIEKYGLLKHIHRHDLVQVNSADFEILYHPHAFWDAERRRTSGFMVRRA